MTDIHVHDDEQGNAYDGLLVNDAHWAFGTDFEDPLAGVDTTVPSGVEPHVLATYCLMLGDDALVLSQRLAEWCSNAPDLEEDIALANIALDLLGQARLLLARAAAADPALVPNPVVEVRGARACPEVRAPASLEGTSLETPEGSPVPAEDRLAFFRSAPDFRNVRLAEVPNGDFGETIARLLLFSTWRLAVLERLADSRDAVVAAVAAKGVKEVTYHRDFAGRWFVTLASGTEESRRRVSAGLAQVWPLWAELFETHDVEAAAAAAGVGVDPAGLAEACDAVLEQVLATSGVDRPKAPGLAGVRGRKGRDGLHTEALSRLLAEMQSVARAHPRGQW